jgi:hypothetical protein
MAGITKRFDTFIQAAVNYKNCPAGATTTLKRAGAGAVGDYLGRLICTITNNLAMTVDIVDGNLNAVRVLQNGSIPSTNGVVALDFGMESVNGNWAITTANGVNVLATGIFD